MKQITQYFITASPFLILYVDYLVLIWYGGDATITGCCREWHKESNWPEFTYVVCAMLLWAHLFRRWL